MNTNAPVTAHDRSEMARMVKEMLGEAKAVLWWKTPNPQFGNIAPMWLFVGSQERRVRNFIFDAYENDKYAKKYRADYERLSPTAGEPRDDA